MIKNIVQKIHFLIRGNKPLGAPTLRQFRKLTVRQRQNLRIVVNGKDISVMAHLRKMSDKLPIMRWENGQLVNHEKELKENYMYDGFDGVANYLKQIDKATKKGATNIKESNLKKV